ncbi:hypothetical protein HBI56_155640 [Parastagonospora nodorum]|uniref:RING-type domain-containing protein n=1 Tax=Phaeosphaeria nodorum (strain SN15 / ATCC MYA-4574 / FGSC 10173) TaxID=321614 RepID=A0A7U2NNX8_PHANO|nr:hypothetical protein HBH56_118340 [Parastagonospora nodorum]QRD05279.1 hypothetical protein JI435_111770 [Parastagonospora nodorum SN15]KAH3929053.1 hypothetical protein HBH54_130870 [Parastagonospora nodorum]KAH3974043.1 hypothetical protein HBH52_140660 [Parastagonospora nodorum]KAH4104460.1 hypothetical protein HBH46_101830 [Parastagonospora nodorum]
MAQRDRNSGNSMEDADKLISPEKNAPASAEVYRQMRQRFRRLSEIPKPQDKSQDKSQILTKVTIQELCSLVTLQAIRATLEDKTDEDIMEELQRAQLWLDDVLASHAKLLKREHYMRMFRLAIEKELAGTKEQWTQMEKVYMALTDPNAPDVAQRLRSTIVLVLEQNFADRLAHVSKLATERTESVQRARTLDQDANDIRSRIVDRTREIRIDHFACAVPLPSLQLRADIVDDNEGCCPICQNSYTNLSTNTVSDLLADYPVRIKYCGHVIGKACLEQWMSTPKIDEAKYPHRTCPLCRVKIEGVQAPHYPKGLRTHLRTDRIANESLREFLYGWDIEIDECMDTIAASMSEEIACEELLIVIKKMAGKTRWGYEEDEKMLKNKMQKVKEERWVWGFRGDRIWRQMRDEWMNSGTVRKG